MDEKISQQLIGQLLKLELTKGYDIIRLSRWAYSIYFNNIRSLDSHIEELLEYLFRMEDDPQFEYTEAELQLLAEKLINEEKDPIKQINDIKLKMWHEKNG